MIEFGASGDGTHFLVLVNGVEAFRAGINGVPLKVGNGISGTELEGSMRINSVSGKLEIFTFGVWSLIGGGLVPFAYDPLPTTGSEGELRYNDMVGQLEIYAYGGWDAVVPIPSKIQYKIKGDTDIVLGTGSPSENLKLNQVAPNSNSWTPTFDTNTSNDTNCFVFGNSTPWTTFEFKGRVKFNSIDPVTGYHFKIHSKKSDLTNSVVIAETRIVGCNLTEATIDFSDILGVGEFPLDYALIYLEVNFTCAGDVNVSASSNVAVMQFL